METNTHRSTKGTANRELLTEFYAGFNHFVTNRDGRADVAAALADDVSWTAMTSGGQTERTYTGIDDVVENAAATPREGADHLQALPERFTEAGETVVVEGAYVGTADGTPFDIAFVHVYELEDETIQRCRAYTDTALERRTFAH
ncbi:nuclear transport factor 2 family protein [Natronorubrum sp. FCH18a]|uniref:nuclear transport factor 2 family protein n=1 Tax=Natronorubrum sp. FCH18a TaxID=3447018 RepID=UPI003F511A29